MNTNEVLATLATERLGTRGAPQRRRERPALVQRPVPVGDPHRRRPRRDQRRSHPGARAPRATPSQRRPTSSRRREVRPHPPDGRHAGHPRPGVRRLRRAGPLRRRAAAGASCPGSAELPLGGTAVGTGINAPAGLRRRGHRATRRRDSDLPLTEARDHFEAQGARDALVEASRRRCAPSPSASTRSQRHPLDGLRPAHRAGRDLPARPAAGLVDHARQGQPGDVRGRLPGRRAGRSATTPPSRGAARPATSSST